MHSLLRQIGWRRVCESAKRSHRSNDEFWSMSHMNLQKWNDRLSAIKTWWVVAISGAGFRLFGVLMRCYWHINWILIWQHSGPSSFHIVFYANERFLQCPCSYPELRCPNKAMCAFNMLLINGKLIAHGRWNSKLLINKSCTIDFLAFFHENLKKRIQIAALRDSCLFNLS